MKRINNTAIDSWLFLDGPCTKKLSGKISEKLTIVVQTTTLTLNHLIRSWKHCRNIAKQPVSASGLRSLVGSQAPIYISSTYKQHNATWALFFNIVLVWLKCVLFLRRTCLPCSFVKNCNKHWNIHFIPLSPPSGLVSEHAWANMQAKNKHALQDVRDLRNTR